MILDFSFTINLHFNNEGLPKVARTAFVYQEGSDGYNENMLELSRIISITYKMLSYIGSDALVFLKDKENIESGNDVVEVRMIFEHLKKLRGAFSSGDNIMEYKDRKTLPYLK